LTQGLREGFRILADIGGERFTGIAGALADAYDSSGGIALEDGAVFSECELSRSVLCGLPIGVVCAALNIVDHLAIEIERNAELDQGLGFALLSGDALAGRIDGALMTRAYGRQCGASGAVEIDNAATGQISLECA
jgi:hypothetical protein